MQYSKNFFNCRASSILESVISLSIISICLFISILVYTAVFSSKTSTKYYFSKNMTNELYFMMQVRPDSISLEKKEYLLEEQWMNTNLKKISVKMQDSSRWNHEKVFYINPINE